jgi:hypothetical protein
MWTNVKMNGYDIYMELSLLSLGILFGQRFRLVLMVIETRN